MSKPQSLMPASAYSGMKLAEILDRCKNYGLNIDDVEGKADAIQLLVKHEDGIREKIEREKAEKERADKEKADRERAERDKAEKEKADRERAERDRLEREKAERERAEKEFIAKVEGMKLAELLSMCTERKLDTDSVESKQDAIKMLIAHNSSLLSSSSGPKDPLLSPRAPAAKERDGAHPLDSELSPRGHAVPETASPARSGPANGPARRGPPSGVPAPSGAQGGAQPPNQKRLSKGPAPGGPPPGRQGAPGPSGSGPAPGRSNQMPPPGRRGPPTAPTTSAPTSTTPTATTTTGAVAAAPLAGPAPGSASNGPTGGAHGSGTNARPTPGKIGQNLNLEAMLSGQGGDGKKVFGGVRMLPKSAQTFGTVKFGSIPEPAADVGETQARCEVCKEHPAASKVMTQTGREVKACKSCISELNSDESTATMQIEEKTEAPVAAPSVTVPSKESPGTTQPAQSSSAKPPKICERCGVHPVYAKVAIVETGQSFKVCKECVSEMRREAEERRAKRDGEDVHAQREKEKEKEKGGDAARDKEMNKDKSKIDALAEKARQNLEAARAKSAQAKEVDKEAAKAYEKSLETAITEAEKPLKEGWREAKRAKDGKVYYYHVDTKETTWTRPC